jgi:hypothetical protein
MIALPVNMLLGGWGVRCVGLCSWQAGRDLGLFARGQLEVDGPCQSGVGRQVFAFLA